MRAARRRPFDHPPPRANGSRRRALRVALVLCGVGVFTLAVVQAHADRAPTKAENAAIRKVAATKIPSFWRGKTSMAVRLSVKDGRYALVMYRPGPGFESEVQQADAILVRSGGRWLVVVGPQTSALGCALPLAVALDLLGPSVARLDCSRSAVPRLARVYVTSTGPGGRRAFRPAVMPFAQDATLIGLRWRGWGRPAITGTGTLEHNTCDPTCADGSLEHHPVTLTLERREICDRVWQYRRLSFRFVGPQPPGLLPVYREIFPCRPEG